ncbi:MAG: hypothetical protein IH624_04680 [Phycisphaerae bacterium]|nr:hypothetical protein [Phycisphaerae bacterium]
MARRLTVLLLAACLALLGMTGCKKSPEETLKTKAQFKAEADKEITEENMAEHLDSLEKDIEADMGDEE